MTDVNTAKLHLQAHMPLLSWRVHSQPFGELRGVFGEYVFIVTMPANGSGSWQCEVHINQKAGHTLVSYGVGPEQTVVNAIEKLRKHLKRTVQVLESQLAKVGRGPSSPRPPPYPKLRKSTGNIDADLDNAYVDDAVSDMMSRIDPDTLF